MSLVSLPRQLAVDVNGSPRVGAKAYYYQPSTAIEIVVYTTGDYGTPHTNPVESVVGGLFPAVYINPAVNASYKLVVTDEDDNEIYSENNVPTLGFTQAEVAALLFPRTAAEIAGSVTPTNYQYEPGNILRYGADPTGVAASDAAVDAAQDAGYQPYAPRGDYLFSATIAVKAPGFRGDGPNQTKLRFVGVDAFTLASNEGFGRPACLIEGFSVDASNSTNCDGKYFFYAPGVASGAAAAYNSGITIQDIEVGRNNRFGGGFHVKDCFRMNVQNIGFTNVSWMIRVVGSVVQCKFRNISSNNDTAGTTLSQYGISTETASYSDIGTGVCENIRFIDCSYIRGKRGINHQAGSHIEFINFDCEADDFGALINAECYMHGGILAPGIAAAAWIGVFRGVSPSVVEDGTVFDNVDVNTLRAPATPASSYGFDLGDNVSPIRGLIMKNCRVRGATGSLQSAIRGRILDDATIEDSLIEDDTCLSTEVDITTAVRLFFNKNRIPGGAVSITDGGNAAAFGSVQHNYISTLTFAPTTRANWVMDVNDTIVRRRFGATGSVADGGTISHGLSSTPTSVRVTTTTSGEFASVTAVAASTFTVAIKTHAGSAGTTATIYWEASY